MKKTTLMTSWLMWFLAACFYALDYFQHTAPSVLLKPIADSLHTDITQVGNIMSIYFPIYAVTQIPAGMLLDRYRLRLVLSGACLVVSLGLLFMMTGSFSLVLAGRVLIAIGSAFAFLGALKTASMWLPRAVFPIAVGLTNTIGVLGGILGQAYLNTLIQQHGWEHALFYIGVFGVALAFLLFVFLKTKQNCQCIKTGRNIFAGIKLFRDPQIWVLALYAGIMVGTVVNAFSELYDVVFLESAFQVSSQIASDISIMVFIGIAAGGPTHGVIGRFFGKKQWIIIACGLTVLCFSAIIAATKLALPIETLYVLYFLTGFFVSSMLLSFAVIESLYPKPQHGLGFAILNTVIGLCGFLFQLLLGHTLTLIKAHYPSLQSHLFMYGFMVLMIPLVISFVLTFFIRQGVALEQG